MKNLWIISSAIGTKTAEDKTLSRWMETILTIESINSRDPHAEIHILDTGSVRLPEWHTNLWSDNVTFHDWCAEEGPKVILKNSIKVTDTLSPRLIELNDKITPQAVRDFLQFGYLKSVTESWAILNFLEGRDLSSYDRVYKLSGRYFLTPKFDANQFDNNITMKKQGVSENLGVDNISSVMWCFKGKHYEEFTYKFKEVRQHLCDTWHKTRTVTDLESSLAFRFDNEETTFIPWLGLAGVVNTTNSKQTLISQ